VRLGITPCGLWSGVWLNVGKGGRKGMVGATGLQ